VSGYACWVIPRRWLYAFGIAALAGGCSLLANDDLNGLTERDEAGPSTNGDGANPVAPPPPSPDGAPSGTPDAASPGFPDALREGLALHLRAEDLTVADAALVDAWRDPARPSLLFTQSTPAQQPKFRARSAPEPPSVEFLEGTRLELSGDASNAFRYGAGVSFATCVVVRTSATPSERYEQIFGNEFAGTSPRVGFTLIIDSDPGIATFGVRTRCDSVSCYEIRGTRQVRDDKWHALLGIREGDAARLYIDGIPDGERATDAGVSLASADALRIGASTFGGLPFVGRVGEALVWNRALNATEVAALTSYVASRYPAR
jgi:hypothetical protein